MSTPTASSLRIAAAAEVKRKILAGIAARVYGIDLDQLTVAPASDDLSWTNQVKAAYGVA